MAPRRNRHGTWTVRWRADGHQHSRNFDRRADAERFEREIKTSIDRGTYIDPAGAKTRLDEWITDWHNARLNLRPSTAGRDESYIRGLVLPHLGSKHLGRLTPAVIRQWVVTLDQTYAPATTRKAHQILAASLNTAVTDRMIPTNPCDGTPLPAATQPTHRYLTPTQVRDLADAIDERFRALVWTGALTGLRPGEIAALRLANLDLRDHRLTVTHTAVEQSGVISYGQPKTRAARRTIRIGQRLTGVLIRHLDEYGPGANVVDLTHRVTHVTDVTDSPLVFTSSEGGPLRLTNFRRRQWRRAVEASVGDPMRIHDLRHTHAAISIAKEPNPKVLQERLGHRDIQTTYNVYGHLFDGYDEDLVDALDDTFEGLV
jgi:integrase